MSGFPSPCAPLRALPWWFLQFAASHLNLYSGMILKGGGLSHELLLRVWVGTLELCLEEGPSKASVWRGAGPLSEDGHQGRACWRCCRLACASQKVGLELPMGRAKPCTCHACALGNALL